MDETKLTPKDREELTEEARGLLLGLVEEMRAKLEELAEKIKSAK